MLKILISVLLLFLISCNSKKDLGSSENPINFALVPGKDSAVLLENGKVLERWVLNQTGLHVRVKVPVSFVAVVEAIGTKRVDVAIMNTFGYLLAHEKYGAKSKLIGLNGESAEYWGQIITADPKIKMLQDLHGKKFAFVDPASTSGYILAAKLFKDQNIKPKEVIFAGKHDSVVTMVYQRRVQGGATFYNSEEDGKPQDARRLIKEQYPDVYEKVRILAKTGSIPNDPVVFRKEFPVDLEAKIISALKSFSSTTEGAKALKNLYHLTGFKEASDEKYDGVRVMLLELGKSVQDFVK